MKNILIFLFTLVITPFSGQNNVIHAGESDWPDGITITTESANKSAQIMSCAANTIHTTGYPAWTNYYAGYMFKVNNTSTCNITINCFEARFQGTSGYRIYTKTGTFIGFETLSGSWTLVGTAANVTGISTITCSPIPIVVNVTIPPASSQSFYLTRTDNLVANRHLYVTGAGTAGTTVYASDANVQITEAEYLDTYFILQVGVRRPSFDMYYDKVCGVLPIELVSFTGNKKTCNQNVLHWMTASETNNDRFEVERSSDAISFVKIGELKSIGNSQQTRYYDYYDTKPSASVNYYRLKQVDYNGKSEYSSIISVDNSCENNVRTLNRVNLLGQEVDENYSGLIFIYRSDNTIIKQLQNAN